MRPARPPGAGAPGWAVVEREFRPRGHYRLPTRTPDGLLRRRDGGLARLLHAGEEPVLVHARVACGAVRVRASAAAREHAEWGVERMRFALCLDHDLAPFHRAFARDRLLGPAIRRRPWLRPRRVPTPFEALAWAITEQLIEAEQAITIQRRIVRRYGRAAGPLRDSPPAAVLAARAPAELQACGLSAGRSIALVRAAREVGAGRADLDRHEPSWRRLRRIPGIGAWTLEKLALHGQGRDDQLPAGDLAYLKLVGRLERLGRRAGEDEVRAFFARFEPYTALAGLYLLGSPAARAAPRPWAVSRPRRALTVPAAARW